jgi:hypothetical protein
MEMKDSYVFQLPLMMKAKEGIRDIVEMEHHNGECRIIITLSRPCVIHLISKFLSSHNLIIKLLCGQKDYLIDK